MQRIFTHFLMVTVLFSGIVWAANVHAIAVFDHSDEQSQAQSESQNDIDVELCDHCCHGAAHLVCILDSSTQTYSDPKNGSNLFYLTSFNSFKLNPPTPPPNA